MKVFISYAHPDGLEYARSAAKSAECFGHTSWMWQDDKVPGTGAWGQMSGQLVASDLTLMMITKGSAISAGQSREVEIALANNIPIVAVVIDGAVVPLALSGDTQERTSNVDFEATMGRVAGDLERIRDAYDAAQKRLATSPTSQSALENADARLAEHLTRLNSRRGGLRPESVDALVGGMEQAFLETPGGRSLFRVGAGEPDDLTGFVTIGIRSRIESVDFNDENSDWSFFASQIGRSVARQELDYALMLLSERTSEAKLETTWDPVNLRAIEQAAENIRTKGLSPDRIIAPVGLAESLYENHFDQFEWTQRSAYLRIGTSKLQVTWTSKLSESNSDSFLIFDSNAGTWRVIPDPLTGKALTVSVGISDLYADYVEFICQTRARLDIDDPSGFAQVNLPKGDRASTQ